MAPDRCFKTTSSPGKAVSIRFFISRLRTIAASNLTISRPWVPYVVPMGIYMVFLLVQSQWPEGMVWLYPLKTAAVAAALLGYRKKYEELKVPASGGWENTVISYCLAVAVGLISDRRLDRCRPILSRADKGDGRQSADGV